MSHGTGSIRRVEQERDWDIMVVMPVNEQSGL